MMYTMTPHYYHDVILSQALCSETSYRDISLCTFYTMILYCNRPFEQTIHTMLSHCNRLLARDMYITVTSPLFPRTDPSYHDITLSPFFVRDLYSMVSYCHRPFA